MMRKLLGSAAGLVTIAALLAAMMLTGAQATTFVYPGTTADDVTAAAGNCPGSSCTLRDAIAYAEAHSATAVSLGPPAPTGPYILDKGGQLDVTGSVTLFGAGARASTIKAGAAGRVIKIETTGSASITGVTITNGSLATTDSLSCNGSYSGIDGGGILNFGTLTLTDSAVVGNRATSDGTHIAIGGGIGTGNGGTGSAKGSGSLTLVRTNVSGNYAIDSTASTLGASGGGIEIAGGTVTIVDSTISGNTAAGGTVGAFGGGIDLGCGDLTLASSTLADNIGDVAPNSAYGATDNLNTCLSGNCLNTFTTENSIFADNQGGNSCYANGNVTTSKGFNLEDDSTGQCGLKSSTHDLVGVNPMLGNLGNNGGPTDTQALSPGSPAIDAGNPAGCADPTNSNEPLTVDQRGTKRPQNGRCDIGAYEYVPSWSVQVAPSAQSVAPGGTATMTATVQVDGSPKPGVAVAFTVTTGPNAGKAATATTDAGGHAVFSYSGAIAGTDQLTATVTDASVLHSGTAAVTWTAPAVSLSPASQTLATGKSATITATVTSNGSPRPGDAVTFNVASGPDAGMVITAQADANGRAAFSYSSTRGGTDQVTAAVTDAGATTTSSAASVVWVAPSVTLRSLSPVGPILTLGIACTGVRGQSCHVDVVARSRETIRRGAVVGVTAAALTRKAVTVATRSFSLVAGTSTHARVSLNAIGRRLLTRFYKLQAIVTVTGPNSIRRTVAFRYRVLSALTYDWHNTNGLTTLKDFYATGIPAGGGVVLRCLHGGCSVTHRRIAAHNGRVKTTLHVVYVHLLPGGTVALEVVAPNAVGRVDVVTGAVNDVPSERIECLPPGASGPVTCA